jgi:hypothetical protein
MRRGKAWQAEISTLQGLALKDSSFKVDSAYG